MLATVRSIPNYQDFLDTVFASHWRWVKVTIVPDERVETLGRALVDHFVAFGGIPLLASSIARRL